MRISSGCPTSTCAASACSSAPTSTCRRTMPARSPTTRASAPRCPASATRSSRGAAVMVTSHLGRPTEGEWKAGDSLAPIAQRLSELLGHAGAAGPRLGRRRAVARRARAGPGRAARELPLQQGREEGRRRARAQDGDALRRLRQRRLRHRASRRGDDARHRAVRAGRVRRAAAGRRARRARQARWRTRSVRWWPSSPAPRCRPSSRSCARSRRRSTR